MTKLPVLSGKEIHKALSKMGFRPIRQRGSHVFMQHSDGRSTVVPMPLPTCGCMLKRILSEADVSVDELIERL